MGTGSVWGFAQKLGIKLRMIMDKKRNKKLAEEQIERITIVLVIPVIPRIQNSHYSATRTPRRLTLTALPAKAGSYQITPALSPDALPANVSPSRIAIACSAATGLYLGGASLEL